MSIYVNVALDLTNYHGENNARITSDENHKWITKDWIDERVTTDMKITYNDNGTVTFTSEKEKDG